MLCTMSNTLGELIRSARARNKWLGRELAAKLEIDPGTLSRLENDNYKDTPSPELIARISSVLSIPQTTLLESLGYQVTADETPVSDPLSASIARAVQGWTPAQKRLLWQYIEAVDTAFHEHSTDDEK
jgi:transcriptional regulator with XRE-family HTH domain